MYSNRSNQVGIHMQFHRRFTTIPEENAFQISFVSFDGEVRTCYAITSEKRNGPLHNGIQTFRYRTFRDETFRDGHFVTRLFVTGTFRDKTFPDKDIS